MRQSHMNPEEAFQAALHLRAKTDLGIHFGTFDLSDEPLAEPPQRFRDAAAILRLATLARGCQALGDSRVLSHFADIGTITF